MRTCQKEKNDRMMTLIHHMMALVGGYFGGYAVLTRGDFLGNAQTANLIYLVHSILGRDVLHMLLRVFAVILYMLGSMAFVMVKNKTKWNVMYISIGLDMIAVIIEGLIPKSIDPVIALFPFFFAMSFQWNAFSGNYGYVSSTIFSTNNVRQTTLALSEYLCDKDKKHLHKMRFFMGSLLFFHVGVATSYIGEKVFAERSIWFNAIALLIAGTMVAVKENQTGRKREEAMEMAVKETMERTKYTNAFYADTKGI